jgi:hypothetical protein
VALALTRTAISIVTGWLFCTVTLHCTVVPASEQVPLLALAEMKSS